MTSYPSWTLHSFSYASKQAIAPRSGLFREYIGGEDNNVKFSDVPINPNVEFHYILAFAIDYTTSSSSSPTNGKFSVFWDKHNLGPFQVSLRFRVRHSKVTASLSLGGGQREEGQAVTLVPLSPVDSWVFQRYSDSKIFAECIGKLITTLKNKGVISFASIAPYDDDEVQRHYMALWKSYGHIIDYVNFQFYAYGKGTTVSQFINYFQTQSSNYKGGNILASFSTEGSGGLSPKDGLFKACNRLKSEGKLGGIFVWSADSSKKLGFRYEKESQALLADPHLT
ncbi:chitinase 2-like protein [Tanacetum coccineum]